jgi:uncharacterized protein with PQ loop repeat
MTREQVAVKICWSQIVWLAGIINVVAMLPQLWQIISTHKTESLSLGMFWIYFWIQVALSLQGFFRRDKMLMWCMGFSAMVSATIITAILYIRHF